ncbi:MAG TPA: hopanoid biosynthesis-associated protein HpnK [Steroidobacteraceae bacterium]|nr:hopanoid biosynthesis-associated protein HpnK [Steroidobacteraceae bacterium]
MKFLIVTADDFGLHEAVNRAVEHAARDGALTAASLMVGAPAAADAVRRARGLAGLSVGLHLVLADGWSVLPPHRIPALVDAQGRFGNNMVRDGVRFFALPAVRRQLEAEIRAQFQAFAETGLPLDHVNAHKHFHLHPTLLEMLLRIGSDFGIPAVRLPREPQWIARRAGGAIAGPAVAGLLAPWLAIMRRRLRAAGIAHNDYICGLSDSGSMHEARLLEILGRLPEGVTEIYLHPAVESGAAIAASMSAYRHADELAALVSPRVRAAIAACGAATGGFRRLAAMRQEARRAA